MNNYIDLIRKILNSGVEVETRSGKCRMLTHQTLSFDMEDGFPRLSNRYVPFKSVAVELEGFIGGITSKGWYQERGCKFWDGWANPQEVERVLSTFNAYHDSEKYTAESIDDLGPIYGWQWRRFGQNYNEFKRRSESNLGNFTKITPLDGICDQLNDVLKKLKYDPDDRRMQVSSVNPEWTPLMALPACHNYWKVDKIGDKLDLFFHMRSWDVYLGGPANIQSYSILLHLLAKHANLKPGKVTVFASNAHLYENLLPQCYELLDRPEKKLSTIEFTHNDFWDWDHTKINCVGYEHSGKLEAKVSI